MAKTTGLSWAQLDEEIQANTLLVSETSAAAGLRPSETGSRR